MWEYLARNLKADVNILVLLNWWVYGDWRNVVFNQNGLDFVIEISFCKTPFVDEKMLILATERGWKSAR